MREVRVRTPRTVSSVGTEAAVTDAGRRRRLTDKSHRLVASERAGDHAVRMRCQIVDLIYRLLRDLHPLVGYIASHCCIGLYSRCCPAPVAAAAVAKRRHVNTTMN